jgi:hypothetical protein
MKQSGKLFPGRPAEHAGARKIDANGRHLSLSLEDDQAFKERGYNPYDTIVHARDTRRPDLWRHKPKRA